MKTIAPLFLIAAALGGCTVVPVGPPVVYGPSPGAAYSVPPPVLVVPSRPYYGGYGYYGHRRGHRR